MKPKKLKPYKQKLILLTPTGMLIEDNILLLKQCFVSNINQIPLPNNMQPFNSFQSLGSVGYEAGVTVSSLLDAFWPPGVLCSVLGSRLKVSMA